MILIIIINIIIIIKFSWLMWGGTVHLQMFEGSVLSTFRFHTCTLLQEKTNKQSKLRSV